MLIKAFRSTQFLPVILLVIISSAFWYLSYTSGFRLAESNGMPFYDLAISFLSLFPAWVSALAGFVLITTQAIHLNLVLNKHEVLYKQSWLPSLLYLMAGCLLPPFLWIHPILFVNSILIFAFDKIFSLYKGDEPRKLAFDSAFLISIGALFYLPAIVLFIFYFLCLIILRPFSWREWIVGLMGLLLPFFFVFLYYFLNDHLQFFYEQVFVSGIKRKIDLQHLFTVQYSFSLVMTAVLFVLSLLRLQTNYFKNTTKARLIQQVLILLIPICFVSVLVSHDEHLYRFSTLAIPFSVYISYYFLSGKKLWIMEAMFLLYAGSILYNYFIS